LALIGFVAVRGARRALIKSFQMISTMDTAGYERSDTPTGSPNDRLTRMHPERRCRDRRAVM